MGFVEPAPESPAPRLSAREGRRPRDMIISLVVLLVPIALILTFYRVVLEGDRPLSKDPTSAIELASREFPVLVPSGLGEDWHLTSANFQRVDGGATLRIGYVDPDKKPILLIQSSVDSATLVPAEVGAEGTRIGTYRTANSTWMQYTGRPGESALIQTQPDRTILIIGPESATGSIEKLASSTS
ncbi:hypothetical protein Ait01nite_007840 [Actinoplanes italicus]|uniref:Uncharacterized protein DUF4245 n=1 Tax=Actinoplanes italicus TaxID=113567 RepID=A0A2T0KLM5_9ACTN|nr:DUF4245 domain-containing protein [Actinoplanes italicus]PRX24534.1 uncharacterized protein DUF4245 [Actinoplanes italicus]GIE27739.1 hypothetical protein Ait01nite_007840 [Actinoplanes italicus]